MDVIVSKEEVKSIFYSSEINCLWIPMEEKYILPAKDDVELLLKRTFFEKYHYKINSFDCNTFALTLAAFISQERYVRQDEARWCFGIVCGVFPTFSELPHCRNIVVCDDRKVYTVEPQDDSLEVYDGSGAAITTVNYL